MRYQSPYTFALFYRSVLPWLLGHVLLAYAAAADNGKASSTAVTVTP
jgi:hypothetical protein